MTRRIVFAAIMLTLVVTGFYFDSMKWLLVGLVSLIAVFCTFELTEMMKRKGLRVYRRVAAWGVLVLILEAAWTHMQFSMLVFGVAVCMSWAFRLRGPVTGAWGDVSATCLTLAYIGLPMAAMTRLFLAGPHGEAWLLLTLAVIWTTDSAALFVGKAIGRNKLWPKISPGKTWEGTIGGVVGAILIAWAAGALYPPFFRHAHGAGEILGFAVLFSIIGQIGDLAESLLKRDAGVKDSGSELTGHGGFLDLMDAVLFAMIPLLAYLQIFHPEVLNTPAITP